MRLGSLASKVTLQSPSTSADATGQLSFSYSSQGMHWAHVEQAGSSATWAEGIDQLNTYSIVMHYDPSISIAKGWRILHDSKTLEVQTVNFDTQSRQWVELVALVIT